MRNLRFICCQPAIQYYAWQVEVLINNFVKMGVDPNWVDIVCATENDHIPEAWVKLAKHYSDVKFFFYNDTRETKHYISSVRPNILKQHFQANKHLEQDTIFYHDCDILFTKPITSWITNTMIQDENWYGSDVRWYISYDYIASKGQDVLDKMTQLVDIDQEVVKSNEHNCIGAQYLLKNIDYKFWERVEHTCEILFKDITELNKLKKAQDDTYHELQIWCSDMWCVLWDGWKNGIKTIPHPSFDFSWANQTKREFFMYNIFHNAGIVDDTQGYFFKGKYTNILPYGEDLKIDENSSSFQYWKEIQRTGLNSPLL